MSFAGSPLKLSEILVKPRTSQKQDRHLPDFAAEIELVGVVGQLLDQFGRDVVAEGAPHFAPLRFLFDIKNGDQKDIENNGRYGREGDIKQNAVIGKKIPGCANNTGQYRYAADKSKNRLEARNTHQEQQTKQDNADIFNNADEIRARQIGFGEDCFQHLRLNFNARHGIVDRRRLEVEKAGCRCADENKLSFEAFGADIAVQDILGGDESVAVMRPVVKPDAA